MAEKDPHSLKQIDKQKHIQVGMTSMYQVSQTFDAQSQRLTLVDSP